MLMRRFDVCGSNVGVAVTSDLVLSRISCSGSARHPRQRRRLHAPAYRHNEFIVEMLA